MFRCNLIDVQPQRLKIRDDMPCDIYFVPFPSGKLNFRTHQIPPCLNTADENTILKERLAWFEKQVYGQKSEKTEVVLERAEQIPMFDEAEQESDINPKTLQPTEVKAHKRVKRTSDEIYADMEVEEVYHEVEDKTCDKCGSEMVIISKEKIRDELVYVKPHFLHPPPYRRSGEVSDLRHGRIP